MIATTYAWIALFAPLAGCVLIALLGTWLPQRAAGYLASLAMFVSFFWTASAGLVLLLRDESERTLVAWLWTWLRAGSFEAQLGILVDPLTVAMMMVVTGVGFLIHVYSIGYMHGDPQERRFFAYMNLFVFSMLLLVMAGNFVILLAGWGMVGLSSYLLIGFWHQRSSAVAAAKKAFVMNAIGDVGIALALFLVFREVGTVDYLQVFAARGEIGEGTTTMNAICALLLVGAVAKSAQLPLHTWLPDAMEGPTPVSALIHAATMVTAGVYLIARMNPLFAWAPDVSAVIVVIGAVGLLFAGLIGLVQNDIKRVIAYSTMSQIAYMFMAVGLGAYWAGIFHLVTHAFFKALLFMGAGAVIHALEDEQDIRNMGGMRRYMPQTHFLFTVATLALIGIFPLSGGFSKDAIIASGLAEGSWVGWVALAAGLAGALLTALYSMRLLIRVFHGEPSAYAARVAPHHTAHGEAPTSMLWPLWVLGLGTLVLGVLQLPGWTHALTTWLEPIAPVEMLEPTLDQEWIITGVAVGLGVFGIILALFLWGGHAEDVARLRAGAGRPFATLFEKKFYVDELYDVLFFIPAAAIARFLRRFIERPFFQLPLDGIGIAARGIARQLGLAQGGIVRQYATVLAVGVGALAVWFLVQAAS